MEQFRGVNLGGWLVLERWISPSVFRGTQATDEHSLVQKLGYKEAKQRLQLHRESFITEDVFKKIAQHGLNAIRLPVGYWLFDDEDGYVGGSQAFVDRALKWANVYGLKVVLCLHGAPGSQNGWDHSGKSGAIGWGQGNTIQRTVECIRQMCEQFGQYQALAGIEILNEPHWNIPVSTLMAYYHAAGQVITDNCHSGVAQVMSDSFRPKEMLKQIVTSSFNKPVLDIHMYQLFTPEDQALDVRGHLDKAARWQQELEGYRRKVPVIVGEWCAALDEHSNPAFRARTFSDRLVDYERYAVAQQRSFDAANVGWFYWTARTEDGGIWSFLDVAEILPR